MVNSNFLFLMTKMFVATIATKCNAFYGFRIFFNKSEVQYYYESFHTYERILKKDILQILGTVTLCNALLHFFITVNLCMKFCIMSCLLITPDLWLPSKIFGTAIIQFGVAFFSCLQMAILIIANQLREALFLIGSRGRSGKLGKRVGCTNVINS